MKALIVGLAASLAIIPSVHAYDLPNVNLGSTSFIDVPPRTDSNWVFSQYLQYYTSDKLTDSRGHQQKLPKTSIDLVGSITQLIYIAPEQPGVPRWGINFINSQTLDTNIDDGLNNRVLSSRDGFGDLRVGPFIQADTIMRNGRPFLSQRFELGIVAPVGAYDPKRTVNPGANVWQINPYYAATMWFTPKWTGSLRFHYLWSSKNTDPPASLGPNAESLQGGQALHANFATEYEVLPGFRLGVNGYWLNQFTDSKINGDEVEGRRERVVGFGPGAMFNATRNDIFYFNFYKEFEAKNRSEGNRFFVRYVHAF
jgi:hypothetical protein